MKPYNTHSFNIRNAVNFYLNELNTKNIHNASEPQAEKTRVTHRVNCDAILHGAYLTHQEYRWLKHIIQKKTISDTARILGLSPRTVEFYFNNIKKRFNTKKKKQVIALFTQQEKTFGDLDQPRNIEHH